eukprot:jgi/Mesvir1/5966/Mv00722-RA.1
MERITFDDDEDKVYMTNKQKEDELWSMQKRFKLSSEYDSEMQYAVHNITAKLFKNGAAKLKASFRAPGLKHTGWPPLLSLRHNNVEASYDVGTKSTTLSLMKGLGKNARARLDYDITNNSKVVELRGEAGKAAEATARFGIGVRSLLSGLLSLPVGLLQYSHYVDEGVSPGVSGFTGIPIRGGIFIVGGSLAMRAAELKYKWKNDDYTIIPSYSTDRKAAALTFKKMLNDFSKISTYYDHGDRIFSATYRWKPEDHVTLKLGYDSSLKEVSLDGLVGSKYSGAAAGPKKSKVQLTMRVPQDNFTKPAFAVHAKKRWDF